MHCPEATQFSFLVASAAGESGKTALSKLNEYCQKEGASLSFPVNGELMMASEVDTKQFKYVVQLTTCNGAVFEGTGIASSKKSAKQQAAEEILLKLDNNEESLLTGYKLEELQLEEKNMTKAGTSFSLPTKDQAEDREKLNKEIPSGTVVVTRNDENEIEINIKLPYPPNEETPAHKTTLMEMVLAVRELDGEKISKLMKKSMAGVDNFRDPAKVLEQIAVEQNLHVDFLLLVEGRENHGSKVYTCIMQVEALSSKDDHQASFVLTQLGTGNSRDAAKESAAKQFLLMCRMILNAD